MADIKDQLIKDSYNYVLQSDLSTGVVYRIGGSVPLNPIFSSGLTINDSFVYSGAGEQNGYALLTDGTGYAYWGPVSGASQSSGVTSITVGNGLSASSSTGAVTIIFTGSTGISGDYLPLSGGTVTGATNFTAGLTANTISATMYNNLPVSVITGGSNIGINNTNGNVTISFTGTTGSNFTGGTVTGVTNFTNGLTANTISATTYQNLPFSGNVIGNGITNYVPKWTGSTGLGNSQIFDDGTNVGIGTTSPSAKLDVIITGGTIGVRISGDSSSDMIRLTQTGSGNAILIEDSLNPDTTPFVVSADGRVGIGLTSPLSSYKLHVRNGTATNSAAASGTVAAFEGSGATYVTVLSPDANNAGISFGSNSDRFGAFNAWNHNSNQFSFNTDKTGGFITFSTDQQTERMRIDSSGNVGIGTTSPSARLDVSGNTLLRSDVTLSNLSSSANTRFIVSNSNGVLSYRTDVLTGTTITITGGTNIQIAGSYPNFGINYTGQTSFPYLPLSGGTVTGNTIFQNGITTTTISANTYQNLPYSGTVVGSGTSNYIPKWTGSTSLGDSNIVSSNEQVGINTGTNIERCAALEILSTTGGVLFPRMTEQERDSISNPIPGLIVYCTDKNEGLFIYKSSGWIQMI